VERFVTSQFCDDIRNEVGNKFSLMGCYQQSLQVKSFPASLPKLCAEIRMFTPLDRPWGKLSVRLMRGDIALGEVRFPAQEPASSTPTPEGAQWFQAIAFFVMTPFIIESPCAIRVEVETEEGILRGGSLWIEALDAANAALLPQLLQQNRPSA
jgi:hypothetical protein